MIKVSDELLQEYLDQPGDYPCLNKEEETSVISELLELRKRLTAAEKVVEVGRQIADIELQKAIEVYDKAEKEDCSYIHNFPVANGAIGDTCTRCGVRRDAVR